LDEWKQLVQEQWEKYKDRYKGIHIDEEYRLINPDVREGKKPYIGFDISPNRLTEFKDQWRKILEKVDPEKTEAPDV
jgi:hypothetical protein